jgi:hypothetical protein
VRTRNNQNLIRASHPLLLLPLLLILLSILLLLLLCLGDPEPVLLEEACMQCLDNPLPLRHLHHQTDIHL